MATETVTPTSGKLANAQAYTKAALLLASELEEPLAMADQNAYLRLQALSATLLQLDAELMSTIFKIDAVLAGSPEVSHA